MDTITCTKLNLLKTACELAGEKVATELRTRPLNDNEERISWRERQKLNPSDPWKATNLGR